MKEQYKDDFYIVECGLKNKAMYFVLVLIQKKYGKLESLFSFLTLYSSVRVCVDARYLNLRVCKDYIVLFTLSKLVVSFL